MFGLGPMEIAVILIVMVLLFGKKLPDVGTSLGKAISNFKNASSNTNEESGKIEKEENSKIEYDQVVDEYKPSQEVSEQEHKTQKE